jgi:hypothetical protein
MTVWVVLQGTWDEGSDIDAIFDSEEKADAYIAKQDDRFKLWADKQEWDVQ